MPSESSHREKRKTQQSKREREPAGETEDPGLTTAQRIRNPRGCFRVSILMAQRLLL
ncbi:unnamed protein product [Linum tenue]|uniref:Uncharacterized protein n=1 Tax=Linum tenue TaxID=586396 RepID=A0AAV0GSR4_9ROSI|nr:unnamed protein product [Linum tenue]